MKNVVKDAAKSREKFLGVIYIGETPGENYRPKIQSKEDDNPLQVQRTNPRRSAIRAVTIIQGRGMTNPGRWKYKNFIFFA